MHSNVDRYGQNLTIKRFYKDICLSWIFMIRIKLLLLI